MTLQTLNPQSLFAPIGPYSHIAKRGSFIAISGTPAVDSATAQIVGDDAYLQTKQIIHNMRLMLDSVGASLQDSIHVRVYLTRAGDFADMNRAYSEEFGDHQPARTVVVVAALPKKGALLTMDLTAIEN